MAWLFLTTPLLAQDISGLRVAIAGGYFQKNVFPEAVEAVARVAKALDLPLFVNLEGAYSIERDLLVTTPEPLRSELRLLTQVRVVVAGRPNPPVPDDVAYTVVHVVPFGEVCSW